MRENILESTHFFPFRENVAENNFNALQKQLIFSR
jgi:hypothetical protein